MMLAMEASLKMEPLPLDKREREQELPVGLKNVGNTCYFNSFIQALFFLPNLSMKLMSAGLRPEVLAQLPAPPS